MLHRGRWSLEFQPRMIYLVSSFRDLFPSIITDTNTHTHKHKEIEREIGTHAHTYTYPNDNSKQPTKRKGTKLQKCINLYVVIE